MRQMPHENVEERVGNLNWRLEGDESTARQVTQLVFHCRHLPYT